MPLAQYTAPPPYDSVNQSNERTHLITGTDRPRRISVYGVYGALTILLVLFIAQNTGLVRCPLNDAPATEKEAIRRQWDLERKAHQVEVGQWGREREDHTSEVRAWEEERVAHRAEHKHWLSERAEEEEASRRKRDAWRKQQEQERWEEEKRRQAIREAFRLEREEEERQRQIARDQFQAEREGWRRQREEEERHRLEVVRRSQGVYWTEPRGDEHCHSFGTRAYSSYLKDIPGDLNWLEVCSNMPPVVIHGREMSSSPHKCERDKNGEVVGIWLVNFDEPACKPYWNTIVDKGCAPGRTGIQRLEARLDGIEYRDDWYRMCATTPAVIHFTPFESPTSCEDRGRWSGMVGIWDYPNPNCR